MGDLKDMDITALYCLLIMLQNEDDLDCKLIAVVQAEIDSRN